MNTVENINSAIQRLEAIQPNDEDAYEQALASFQSIKHLPVLFYTIPPGMPLFRSRPNNNSDEMYKSWDEIFITPPEFVKGFARCNMPHESRFYCSENRPTSYMELVDYWFESKKIGEKIHVTIGRWILKKEICCVIVTTPDKNDRVSLYDQQHGAILDKHLESFDSEKRESAILFYRYLFGKFRKPAKHDPKTYIITTAYSNLVLSQDKGSHGIHYPSVPFGGQGVNFAINSSFCTYDNLELTHVMQDEFTIENIPNSDNKNLQQTNNRVATIQEKEILW